jgi:hypothetical protein
MKASSLRNLSVVAFESDKGSFAPAYPLPTMSRQPTEWSALDALSEAAQMHRHDDDATELAEILLEAVKAHRLKAHRKRVEPMREIPAFLVSAATAFCNRKKTQEDAFVRTLIATPVESIASTPVIKTRSPLAKMPTPAKTAFPSMAQTPNTSTEGDIGHGRDTIARLSAAKHILERQQDSPSLGVNDATAKRLYSDNVLHSVVNASIQSPPAMASHLSI